MIINRQMIGLYTMVRRELIRMFRIASQVFLPPVITTMLYFLIFGAIMGGRIGSIEGVSYTLFIAPGLVMMTVITNAYSNVSTSLFSVRFQKSVEEVHARGYFTRRDCCHTRVYRSLFLFRS